MEAISLLKTCFINHRSMQVEKDKFNVDAIALMVSKELTVEVTDTYATSQSEKRDVVYWIEHSVLDCV